MMLKAKDTLPLFLAVEYVKSVSNLSRGMLHYHPKHESEVIELLNCGEFWVKLGIMKPHTTRVQMFEEVQEVGVKNKAHWNIQQVPVSAVVVDMTKEQHAVEEVKPMSYLHKAKLGVTNTSEGQMTK